MMNIPAGWAWATLGELGRWVGGGTPSKSIAEYWIGDIPWVSPKDMKVERIADAEDHISRSALDESATNLVPAGTVLVVTRSGILRHTLPVAVTERAVALNQDLKALIPADGVEPSYVAWALRASAALILRDCTKAGTTVSNIETARLMAFRIPLAPPAEQRRIAAAIEEHLSRLDAAVGALRSARTRAIVARSSILAAAFSGFTEANPLAQLSDPTRPICYGILKPKTVGELVVPYVEVRSIRNGRIDVGSLHRTTVALHEEFARSKLRAGDVVMAIRGSWDHAAVVPHELDGANISRDVARIAPLPDLNPQFLAHYLSSPLAARYFARVARGVGVRGVNISDLRQMHVPCPSASLQRVTVESIDTALSSLHAVENDVAAALRRSAALRQAILASALRGDLVSHDPGDEPADLVLGRIRAEAGAVRKKTRRRSETLA
jgi:type I restriction enzyme, S subunit